MTPRECCGTTYNHAHLRDCPVGGDNTRPECSHDIEVCVCILAQRVLRDSR